MKGTIPEYDDPSHKRTRLPRNGFIVVVILAVILGALCFGIALGHGHAEIAEALKTRRWTSPVLLSVFGLGLGLTGGVASVIALLLQSWKRS